MALALACTTASEPRADVGTLAAPIVYGADDRLEYFQAVADVRERLAESAVALIPKAQLNATGGLAPDVPTSGARDGLCEGEPFAEQPAAAFCSGVLIDWDLVLTAGHCVRAFALPDFAVVAGYYYSAPGELDVGDGDVLEPIEILDEALDPQGVEPRLDFAWLRLATPAQPPRRPAAFSTQPLTDGDPVTSIGASAGVPLKIASGASVVDARAALSDYFVADTDTSHGASGGGAFDVSLSLAGVLVRGGADTHQTDAGCATTVYRSGPNPAEEHFSYVRPALDALCSSDTYSSSVCRDDCGDPCRARPLAESTTESGCRLAPGSKREAAPWELLVVLGAAGVFIWRASRGAGRHDGQQ